jgi:hypothetical protein
MLSNLTIFLLATTLAAQPTLLKQTCQGCHNPTNHQGGLDLTTPPPPDRLIRIHDRIANREMPPKGIPLPESKRTQLLNQLATQIRQTESARIPMRRLTRDEYEQTLRDILHLPHLDIRDMLPEDRISYHFHKSSETLDISRVQLAAYLDAAESALRQTLVFTPPPTKFRAVGTALFQTYTVLTIDEAMFFAKDSKRIKITKDQYASIVKTGNHDPSLEMCLFRSPGWPYAAFPLGFSAKATGEYRVRFKARSVLQLPGYEIKPGTTSVAMTFRSRKPTSHDIAEDVRSTGGILDIDPVSKVQETTVFLNAGQTVEYGLYGLPVPLIDVFPEKPGTYRYPPFPPGGQPGVAFEWLEIEGPLPQPPRPSLLPIRGFIERTSTRPVPESTIQKFEKLVQTRLDKNDTPQAALFAGYQAFLASSDFLFLDPSDTRSRLSYFLSNSRPSRATPEQYIAAPTFDRFIKSFTDDWLDLRNLRRDDTDNRLFPEYRFDDYLNESAERETRAFITALIRDNLHITNLIDARFVYANDRLATHYNLPPLQGAALRKIQLPPDSPLGGLLTQAAIMKVTSNGTTTSPVIRGAWVMDRLMGEPPPPPPPGVPAVEPDIRGARSMRDLLSLHTKSPSCAACHASFDPVGLALENFDVMGAWRTHYRGLQHGQRVTGIDRAGHDYSYTLSGLVDSSGQLSDGRHFKDIRELKQLLTSNPRQLAKNFLHQLTICSTGAPVRFSDRGAIEKILDSTKPGGYRAKDLLLALIASPIFRGQP